MRAFEKKTAGILTTVDLKSARARILYWSMFAFLVLASAVCLFPPLWVMLSSFKDMKEFLQIPPTIIPRSFHPEKLPEVWRTLNFSTSYANSLYMAAGELFFAVVVNGLVGYVISRLRPKGYKVIFTVILWTLMMPTSISMVPLFMMFVNVPYVGINLTNTFWPMWMMAGANAFNILIFKNFFDSISMSYLESARIDGCSNFGIFARIILPLSRPIIMVVSIFTVNSSWESFLWPYLVLKAPNLHTVAVKLFVYKSSGLAIDQYMMLLLLAIIPPVVIFIIFQKYIMGGFTVGGIKG